MSNAYPPRSTDRSVTDDTAGAFTAGTTTVVRGDAVDENSPELHVHLREQLREARLRTGSNSTDMGILLRLISAHYENIDQERRGIVQSMRLMADEARAMAHEVREQSSEHLQVILDHIKDVVLTVDEDGVIQTFNPTGERVFGFVEAEVVGQRIDHLIPQITAHVQESITQALHRLAANSDLGSRELEAQRKGSAVFPAEIAVSKARLSRREMFVLCLRDVTERRDSEQAVRESEARYRLLVDHAPEAIVVFDADESRFIDANEYAEQLFGLERAQLLKVGIVERSPSLQPGGLRSAELAASYTELALSGQPQVYEWVLYDGFGKEITCEVRLVRFPSGNRRLVRGSIADISLRKRSERVAAAEREVFARLAGNSSLSDILGSITRLIDPVGPTTMCSVSVLAEDGQSFSFTTAPRIPDALRSALESSSIDIRHGSCAAAVYLARQVLVADVGKDPFWERSRDAALSSGVRAAWATPIKSAEGKLLGAIGVYRGEPGLPGSAELAIMGHAAQLAAIAIERRLSEQALRASEAKYRGLFESIHEGVYQSSRDGRLLSVNPAFVSILGYSTAEELYALPSVAVLYWNPADRAVYRRAVETEGEIRNAEFDMRTKDGQQVVILENARAVNDTGGRVIGYEGTIANITERKRAEQAVFAEKERAQVTLQSIGDAVISTDAEGRIEYINPVAESLTAWPLAEARGRPIGDVLNLVNEITREPIENPLVIALGRGETGPSADHSVLVTRTGLEVAIQESAAPICDRQGRVIGAVIVFHDVTKERRLKRALSYQASHDALTGLINRREFDNRLHSAVQNAQRGEGSYALLYIDLDQFKVVNDTCGHQAGDRLLRDVTALLQGRVRASDTIARLGGDEFGVLLEGCTPDQAARIADGVRQAIKDYRFISGETTLSVGASVGVVQITPETESVAAIMSAADGACYAAKDEGRNRIHVYMADGLSTTGLHRNREMNWIARITRATEENLLELLFQPIVRIGAETAPAFFELTVRLRDDDGRLVPPSEFLPAAERFNVMSAIDRWVVSRAVELLRSRRDAGQPLPMLAVNLSGSSLNEQAFAEFILQALSEPEIANALCFEITESAAVTSLSNVTFFMRELKEQGCKFALDNFGTGLSSFTYLKTLPVDYLKIDGQFIGQIVTDAVDRSMVEAISKVGKALGIATVAEWVEDEAVLDELKRIGVDFAQGFLLARPQPLAQMG
jgi:diguanylate cyclase (GGDEF)-like protein/PAS domain S-box-containing protein